MWQAEDKDIIFMETVMDLAKQHHTVVHCIPLDRDSGALVPMYFKVDPRHVLDGSPGSNAIAAV